MTSCLPPDRVLAFVRGAISAAARDQIEEHIDGCADCRRLIATAANEATTSGEGSASRAPGELAGTRIGRYVVGERLGEGGMGVVYLAEDVQLRRRVVIKLIRDDEPERLRHEARAMAQLSHPNVVQIYDLDELDDSLYAAMEYLDGGDLRAWLAERTRAPRAIVDAFVQAARGLAAAHAIGIVHRDFKPANVVVSRDQRIAVTDFGLARSAESEDPADIAGTPAYMSPEQWAGEPVDARSDQYSFCVALYEALEGARPVFTNDRAGPPRRAMPAGVWPALRRGLRVRPADRFANMDELIAALRPRRAAAWAIGGAAALALAAGGAWLAIRGDAAHAHAPQPATVETTASPGEQLLHAGAPAEAALVQLSFDDGRGDHARDASGHGFDGAVRGATWAAGVRGGALDFDGEDDVVTLGVRPALDDLPALSICAWILPRSYPANYPTIADKSTDTEREGWHFYLCADGMIGLLTPYRDWLEAGVVRLGTWQHACATWDGGPGVAAITIYQDGAPLLLPRDPGTNREGAARALSRAKRDSDAHHDVVIGGARDENFYFDGRIDDLRIYGRVLEAAEIKALYDAGRPE